MIGIIAPPLVPLDPVHGMKHDIVGGCSIGREFGRTLEQHFGAVAARFR